MSPLLAERLNAARQHRFVGRATERAIFQAALQAAELPFFVLYIFGPGGVGKTTLLGEFVRLCRQSQISAIWLDGRNLEPTPPAFVQALQLELGLAPAELPLPVLAAQTNRQVLLIDTFEKLQSLEDWLREEFLPQLPENVLVVVAGRRPPSPAWRADPGWQVLIKILPLRNFSPDESLAYLNQRAVPTDQHRAILNFTYGHPLALSLIADTFSQRGPFEFKPQAAQDIIQSLVKQLAQKVPGPAHRAALEACALVYMTTEPLLAAMLATPDAHELFDWLRGLSCIESGSMGLFPHDLARETLTADLRWRNPDWYAELHRRARLYYSSRLQQVAEQEQQTVLIDYIFLHRDNPVVRPFFVQLQSQWQEDNAVVMVDAARNSDWSRLEAMVHQHEGPEAAQLARHWFTCQPGRILVFRDATQQPMGMLALIALDQANQEEINADPATAAAWRYLANRSPLRAGEKATHFRFWLAHDSYQAVSPVQSLIFINMVRHYLTTPGLAFTFLPCAQPDFWTAIFNYADLSRLPEADFTAAGQRYGVFGHDWRITPPAVWLELLAAREVAVKPPTSPPAPTTTPLVVLSQPDFANAVQQALRDLRSANPAALRHNPLVWSRLVTERAGLKADEVKRAATLHILLKETANQLQSIPRQAKWYNALYHTYFQPALSQEQAAEQLDLPFSTFRRYLKAGVTRLTETLWQQEIDGAEK